MATAEQYADWIVANQDKKGSEQYNTVAQAYKDARNIPAEKPSPDGVEPNLNASQPGVGQPAPQESGFLDNVGKALERRGAEYSDNAAEILNDMGDNWMIPGASALSGAELARRTGGMLAGGIGDVIGEGISSAASYLPDSVKDTFTESVQSVADTDAAKSIGEIYQGFKKNNPKLDREIRDTGNMLGLIGGGAIAKPVAKSMVQAPLSLMPQSAAKQGIAQKLLAGSEDLATTPFQIKDQSGLEKLFNTGAKIENSPTAIEAMKQGVDEGVVHSIKASNPATRNKLSQMTDIMENIRTKSALYGVDKRPSDIAGDSLLQRLKIVASEKTKAGKDLDKVAETLKGQSVDIAPPVNDFFDGMSKMGVSVGDDLKLGFNNSDIKRMSGARNLLTDITERLAKLQGSGDAYGVHKLKRFIDNNVTFGKVKTGLSGDAERIIKNLRRDLDGQLDSTFDNYNKVNSTYAETTNAIKALQDVSGKTVDIMGERGAAALGRKLRTIMSNNTSRDNLIKASQDIEDIAKKYGGKFDDNISMQVLYANELDAMFKPAARTSLGGELSQMADRAARAKTSPGEFVMKVGTDFIDKKRGISQDGAFKSLKKLIKELR